MAVYKLVNCVIKIDGNTVGCVESGSVERTRDGGVTHFYGSIYGKHSGGGVKSTFSLRRAYKADTDTSLLYDLAKNAVPFSLTAELSGVSGSIITLSDCEAYVYRPVMGAANDIMAEEITGEAIYLNTGPTD